ncbi:MAG: hypothetical protein J5958_03450 [Clostridia bacterium]|nr:hypothetical protein [Clostridia bacterium]
MMKRVFAVLLLGLMLCLLLVGCGKTDLDKSRDYMESHPQSSKNLYSVSFCLVSDDLIDQTALAGMQESFNRYTEANYGIHVEFVNKTAAEYAEWLEAKFTTVEEAYAKRVAAEKLANEARVRMVAASKNMTTDPVTYNVAYADYVAAVAASYAASSPAASEAAAAAKTAAENVRAAADRGDTAAMEEAKNALTNAYLEAYRAAYSAADSSGNLGSNIREVYPEIKDDQFDLIYVADYDMLCSLVSAGRLRDLYDELTSTEYRLIKKNMTEQFFKGSILGNSIYAVPNCRVMANYKYLRVNAAKALSLNHTEKMITTYGSTATLRAGIVALGENYSDYVKPNQAGTYADRFTLAEDGAWWVYADQKEQRPTINQDQLFNGALAVTAYALVDDNMTPDDTADDFCPAVKILYEIDTNPALHTILQYGVQGLTYSLKTVADGETKTTVLTKLTESGLTYNVDPKYTGNVFSLYPTEEEYENNTQEYNRRQNNDTIVNETVTGFKITVDQPEGGTCTATSSLPFGKEGQKLTLTAVAAEGYEFVEWTVGDSEYTETYTDAVVENVEYTKSYTIWKATFVKKAEE